MKYKIGDKFTYSAIKPNPVGTIVDIRDNTYYMQWSDDVRSESDLDFLERHCVKITSTSRVLLPAFL